ncbi:MAG: hypothetical protein K2I91_06775, partial [Muribaculaceae bacterium]|nr:hypothetical protein [Muribaculaceae bacterium]
MATNTVADLSLEQLSLRRLDKAPLLGKKRNDYHLTVSGKVSAKTNELILLDRFPFYLGGKVELRFDPFACILDDYDINLGNIKGKLNMAVGAGDNPSIDRFEYKLSTINLMSLLGYLPERYLPNLTGIQAELPISASARLTSPWQFSSQYLPSLQVSIDIPEGEVSYTMSKNSDNVRQGRTFTLEHSPITALFNFNGKEPDNSTFVIDPFTLSSDGVMCRTNATVADLTGSPAFNINTHCEAELGKALLYLDLGDDINADGQLNADVKVSFRLDDLSEQALTKGLKEVFADLDLNLKNATLSLPGRKIDARTGTMTLHLNANAPLLNETDYSDLRLNTGLTLRNATGRMEQNQIDITSLTLNSDNIRLSDLNNLAVTAGGGTI